MLLGGCVGRTGRSAVEAAEEAVLAESRRDSLLQARADSMVCRLSLRERAGLLIMPSLYTLSDAATLQLLTDYALTERVGGVVLLKGDTVSARAIADTLARLGRRDFFLAIDAEWGLAMRLSDAREYPAADSLGATATPAEMHAYGSDIARQCRRLGINMVLGPVVDVLPQEGNRFIGRRAFGSDAKRVAELGCSYSEGLESGGVLSVAKHFPGHGSAQEDSHKDLPVLYRSLHEMEAADLVPFREYIGRGLSCIMVGHIAVAAIDAELQTAAVSRGVIGDLLRRDLGFRGLVITDALNMGGADGADAWEAIAAGADIVLAPPSTAKAIDGIVEAVASGRLAESELNDRCRRVYYYMWKFGLPEG